MTIKKTRILLTGGGSGGHIYPLLAVKHELVRLAAERGVEIEIHYLGPKDKWSGIFLTKEDVKVHSLLGAKLRRYSFLANIIDIPKLFLSLFQAIFKIFWLMPDVIFSKGGPGAFPVVFTGWLYRIPAIIHESDATPGLTNLLSAKFSKRIATTFEKTAHYFDPLKTAWIGPPLRRELIEEQPSQEIAKEILQFDPKKPLILILGGSQGSKRINEFILTSLVELIKETQILHQTGRANLAEVQTLSKAALSDLPLKEELEHRYQALSYLEEHLKDALAAADLVVARAGSSTIAEIAAFGKPAILIPLAESANDHQKMNAFEFALSGGGVMIEETNLLPGIFLTQVRGLLKNREELKKMSAASAKFFKPNAAEIIAQEILKLASF